MLRRTHAPHLTPYLAASLYDFESLRSNLIDNAGACLRTFADSKFDSGILKILKCTVYLITKIAAHSNIKFCARVLLDYDVKAIED